MKISEKNHLEFLRHCLSKYFQANIEPLSTVDAVSTQSIAERGTQMALKNYHFSSIASMNVTLGDPLIKQIINASGVINTPIITCMPVTQGYEQAAKIVKGRIEKDYLDAVSFPPSLHSYKITRPPPHHPLLAKPHMIIPCSKDSAP